MNFYILKPPVPDSVEDRAGRIDVAKMPEGGVKRGPGRTCPLCGRYIGMLTWLPPFKIELETWGKRFGDISRIGNNVVVSRRFLDMYLENQLQGLSEIEPVEVVRSIHRRGKPKEPRPDYFKADISFGVTKIDQLASGYEWEQPDKVCPHCLFDTLIRYRGIVVDQSSWNGDDIFFPRGGEGPLVTQKFLDAFQNAKLVGALFRPAEDEAFDINW